MSRTCFISTWFANICWFTSYMEKEPKAQICCIWVVQLLGNLTVRSCSRKHQGWSCSWGKHLREYLWYSCVHFLRPTPGNAGVHLPREDLCYVRQHRLLLYFILCNGSLHNQFFRRVWLYWNFSKQAFLGFNTGKNCSFSFAEKVVEIASKCFKHEWLQYYRLGKDLAFFFFFFWYQVLKSQPVLQYSKFIFVFCSLMQR